VEQPVDRATEIIPLDLEVTVTFAGAASREEVLPLLRYLVSRCRQGISGHTALRQRDEEGIDEN
jgi:hypothetical protein